MTARTDQELMLAYRAGDRTAFDELFDRYRDPIWRFFRRRFADETRAEELAQDTFLAVIQGARRYEPRATFRSYLFGVAFNVMLAARRKAGRAFGPVPDDFEPAGPTADPVAVIWVKRALADLDPGEREVLMLREYDALSYDEIAALTEVPVGTVRSRLFRAREAMRTKLAGVPRHEVNS
jgi:RNA polymerase sigma-70 factor (ECF subfamily)